MNKKFLVATALAGVLTGGAFFAQTGYAAHEHDAAPPAATQGQKPAAPMGPGMMGGGMGMMGGQGGMGMMGQGGMMGGQGGMGMGMMGGGKGMGCGMMGDGMGMMDGMMGPAMMGTMTPEEQQKYMDATKELRKKLHDKKFEYAEAARNPKTSKADLLKKKKELWDLQQKIHEKAWEFMKE